MSHKTPQDIIFILDESGSMESMLKEPVQAVNMFVKNQQETIENGSSTFSLWKFNTKVTNVIDDKNLQEVTEFSEFKPNGMTALYDAIGLAITTKMLKKNNENVICVILTDGEENSSSKYTSKTILQLIKKMETEHKWSFVYLGANQDAFAVGGGLGIANECCGTFECLPGKMLDATRHTSDAISQYRTAYIKNINSQLSLNKYGTAPAKLV